MNSFHFGKAVGDSEWGHPPTGKNKPIPPPQIRGSSLLDFSQKDMRIAPFILLTDEPAYEFVEDRTLKRKQTIFTNTTLNLKQDQDVLRHGIIPRR